MDNFITITQTPVEQDHNMPNIKHSEIKITNISSNDIRDLKLTLCNQGLGILSQTIKRQRGSLSFGPETQCLELGNLAPNESACLEYNFLAHSDLLASCTHFSVSYSTGNDTITLELPSLTP